ncbi:MAG: fhcA, partial [Firmicutes bacterium]|nr:fhcA [Bacillota bacterium]
EASVTPVIDRALFMMLGNNRFVLEQLQAGQYETIKHFAAWVLSNVRGHAIKIVNPGGVEAWKAGGGGAALGEEIGPYGVRPRDIIATLARVGNELGLPHPVHIHCNNLGLPGNWETTLETMRVLEGYRAHIAHIQFHSYGGEDYATMSSKVPELVDYVNSHPNLTVDVGQVMFGRAITASADAPWEYYLRKVTGHRWVNQEMEAETGCGIVPYQYKDKSAVNTLQWAIGLEWLLLMQDPWRIALTTDHPNGSAFTAYPQIIRLLMDREARREAMARVNQAALTRTHLPELDREYTLSEIAIITRAGPARMLGLAAKGHLGPGADADITIYDDNPKDVEAMFSHPRYVIKGGVVVVEDAELRQPVEGRTFWVSPAFDAGVEPLIRQHFDRCYTIQFENYPVDLRYLPNHEVIPCV